MKNLLIVILTFLNSNLFAQSDGQIDSTFGINGVALSNFNSGGNGLSMAIDNQNNIISVGHIIDSNNYNFAAIKFNSSGIIDTTFASNGIFIFDFGFDDFCNSVAVQPDNKIILSGYSFTWDGFNTNSIFNQFSIIRLNSNGSIDSTFGNNGKFELNYDPIDCAGNAISLQSDGNIVVSGRYNNGNITTFCAIRLTQNGILDTTFGYNGITTIQLDTLYKEDEAICLKIQSDNKILIGGYTHEALFIGTVFGMTRLNANGLLDLSFGNSGVVKTDIPNQGNDYAFAIEIQNDEKILLGGTCKNNKIMAICRYNINGSLDNTFGNNGIDTLNITSGNDRIHNILIQEDEKIILVGQSNNNACIMRLNKYGQIDSTFNNTGINYFGNSIGETFNTVLKINPTKIIAYGYSKDSDQTPQFSLVAFNSLLFSGTKENTAANFKISVYPNPATQTIKLSNITPNTSITITNITGSIILQTTLNPNQEINISQLANGLYFIQAQSKNETQTIKFIKQ
jgi:uncharacterized delta-60 repeat protein